MPESLPVNEGRLSGSAGPREDRRRWLSLACELDRLKALRTLREASLGLQVHTVLGKIASVAPSLPGGIGRWFRGATVAATACRVALLAFKG
jgi:hypothetical protein